MSVSLERSMDPVVSGVRRGVNGLWVRMEGWSCWLCISTNLLMVKRGNQLRLTLSVIRCRANIFLVDNFNCPTTWNSSSQYIQFYKNSTSVHSRLRGRQRSILGPSYTLKSACRSQLHKCKTLCQSPTHLDVLWSLNCEWVKESACFR